MLSDDNIRHYDVHNDDTNHYFPAYTTSCVFYNVYTVYTKITRNLAIAERSRLASL